ncbi:glycosyltransferase [Marinobacter sp. AL4B]|uniref:glycosyltransferase n=1 Tax=Marinobacter sp. AL4B TaxID=2871173 RepID=UPI001CAA6AB8|nr:glycosyltransferase [Marinobacter sp. AL4B]MBZ0333693.1 glycosyltransferase [Marinobacter sp. AL4B]
MKLSIIMDQYNNPYAGTESQVLKLVSGLIERGWEVRFAVLRGTEFSRSGEFPVPIEELNISSISNPKNWLKIYRYGRQLKNRGFQLVHVFFNDASVLCPPALRFAGLKTIISRRDMGFWYNKQYLKALTLTGRFVSAVVCNSEAVGEITGASERIPAKKINVIYNGYPGSRDATKVAKPDQERSRPVVIGVVANLRPIKRIDDLIKAVAELRKAGLRTSLTIVGGGDSSPYEQLADELGVRDSTQFLGSQPEPETFIEDFDIAVLCSETEGFSNAIIEYMRCGKPVVCTRTGGNPEIVEEGENGYLVNVGDIRALAEKLRELIDQPALRERLGSKGAERVAGKYNIDAMLDQHIALYEMIQPKVPQ